jgi:spectinomycin phosphotransferase
MLEKPDLSDDQIIAALRVDYDLPVTAIEFLPIGNDATAWVYRVQTDDGRRLFLKVKKGGIYPPSVHVPHVLRGEDIEQIVAPLPTTAGALWAELDPFALILYPFVEGPTGMAAGLSDSQWRAFGVTLKQIHAVQLPADVAGQVQRETFVAKWSSIVAQIVDLIPGSPFDDPYQRELAAYWTARRDEIIRIVVRCEALGDRLRRHAGPLVLCHTDIHTANILLDASGG